MELLEQLDRLLFTLYSDGNMEKLSTKTMITSKLISYVVDTLILVKDALSRYVSTKTMKRDTHYKFFPQSWG